MLINSLTCGTHLRHHRQKRLQLIQPSPVMSNRAASASAAYPAALFNVRLPTPIREFLRITPTPDHYGLPSQSSAQTRTRYRVAPILISILYRNPLLELPFAVTFSGLQTS
jgi:hypothetical protein